MDRAAPDAQDTRSIDDSHRIVPFARPATLTAFFGRNDEISALLFLLRSGATLITITGPGGVGKTRLALSIQTELAAANTYRDGIQFVPLAAVAEEHLVVPTIARLLGVMTEDGAHPIERLIDALRDRHMLLILDNFEHVLGAGLEIARLHNECPELAIITTSRRALRLIGEQEFPLSPLPVTGLSVDTPLEVVASSPAVALFLARASSANPGFEINESNAATIVQICARLDGLPLAIELAAARVKLMSPQALLGRLSGRLQLLTTGPRDVPRRQQTLRDAISWSYDLLTPEEQTLFRRLSVFAGGATLEAIEFVLAESGDGWEQDAFELTASLVDHSLLVQEEAFQGEPRFRMLETIREYGIDRLESAGEAESTRDAHARYFTSLVSKAAEPEYAREESEHLSRIAPELDNVRGALSWLFDEEPVDSPRAHIGLKLAGSMVRFWEVRGYLQEETRWLTRALSMVSPAPTREQGTALTALGVNAWFLGEFDRSVEFQQRALEIWRELDDRRAIVRSLWFIGLVAGKRRDVTLLQELAAESAPIAPTLGVTLWQVVPRSLLALGALASGDGKGCEELMQSTLGYHHEHGFLWPHAWVLGILSEAAVAQGDQGRALGFMQQSLAEFHQHGDIYATLDGLSSVAAFALRSGQTEVAATLIGHVGQARSIVGHRITWSSISEEKTIDSIRSAMPPESYEQARLSGRSRSLDEVVALALNVVITPIITMSTHKTAEEPFGLSPRERQVLQLLVGGRSNEEIGEALFISPRTAGTHVANILGKLGVHSRAAAVAVAARSGLME